jgi:spore coat protein H
MPIAQTIRVALALVGIGLAALLFVGCGGNQAGKDAAPMKDRLDLGDIVIPSVDKEQIGDNVFDENQVLSYYLTFPDEEYARLMDFSTILIDPYTVNEDRYVEAALKVGDTELPAIGVRFKGSYSIWGCIDQGTKQQISRVEPYFGDIDVCQRFSFKLDFDRFDDRLRVDGLKKLNLHAMAADPSKMRERLGYALFREMGIPAPRAVHARVYINGKYHGLFAAVEQIDGRFTARHFPASGDGNLYKEVWPARRETEKYLKDSALKTNQAPAVVNVMDYMRFQDAVIGSNESNFASQMAPYLDFDELARYIVVDRAINNFDGIMAFYYGPNWGPYNHNFYWYDVGGGRFTLIAWDLDKVFWYPEPYFWSANAAHDNGTVPNWNVKTKDCTGHTEYFDLATVKNGVRLDGTMQMKEIDCDPFLRLLRPQIYDRQQAIAEAFIAGPFSEAKVAAKLEAWQTLIADAIAEDPLVDRAHWQTWVSNLRADLPKFHANLRLMMGGLIPE